MLSGARQARVFYRNWKQEAKGFWESLEIRFLHRLRAVSLFSSSIEENARDTQTTTRETEGAKRERHEKRLNLKKKRDSSQSSCYRLRENWPLIGWNYAGVTPCMRVTSLQNRLALAGKTLNMVQGYRSNEGQTKIVVLFVAEHHR